MQSYGVEWEKIRSSNGPLRQYGTMALFGMVALLFVFYLMRGRIMVEHGMSGTLIERFKPIERFGHWYYSRGQDKKAGIHSSEMKWRLFTKDKDIALQTARAHLE